jgi:hypothetical protein
MSVILANRSEFPFAGFVRVNCDPVPPHQRGIVKHDRQEITYFVGRQTGRKSRGVDFKVALLPGQEIKLDLSTSVETTRKPPRPPEHVKTWFSGSPTINGAPFADPVMTTDGAGIRLLYLARVGTTFLLKLWVHWIPGQSWCSGELLIVSSSSFSTLMTEPLPALLLAWGDAQVLVPGLVAPGPIVGTYVSIGDDIVADGAGRPMPVTFAWPQDQAADGVIDEATINAVANLGVTGIGVDELWPGLGNPYTSHDIEPQKWRDARLGESVRRLFTWEPALLGPNRNSRDSGAQEDQVFKGGECFLGSGVGAETITYLADLKRWARPCHFYEQNGRVVDVDDHPNLAYWDSRPYLYVPDWLGKERGLSLEESHGWHGADDEHFLLNRQAAGARLIDSDVLQEELRHQAMIYLGMFRVDPERLPYLSIPFAARTTCWEGLLVYHCFHNLADRALADRVLVRAKDRVNEVIVPAYQSIPGAVWDWRRDDRIGPGMRWMPWQQAAGSFGLDLMSQLVDSPDGRKVAFKAAQAVMRDAAVKIGGQWTFRDVIAADGAEVPTGAYDWFGCPLAVATVLRNDRRDEKARSVWAQYMQQATNAQDFAWLCPGMGDVLQLPPRKISTNVCRLLKATK